MDSRLPEVKCVEAFPETVELELIKAQIQMTPHKDCHENSELHLDPVQQSLEIFQAECTSQAPKSTHNGTATVVKTMTWCIGGIIY